MPKESLFTRLSNRVFLTLFLIYVLLVLSSSRQFLLSYATSDSTWWYALSESPPLHSIHPHWAPTTDEILWDQFHLVGSQYEFAEWTLPSWFLQSKRGHRSLTSAALKKAKSKYYQTVNLNSALSQYSSCFPYLQLCLLITGGYPRRDGCETVTESKKYRSLSYLQMEGGWV